MKGECHRDRLREAAALAGKITGKHTTLPVLSAVLLHATGNTLVVRATNLEIGIEITIPASIAEEGKVAVPASVLQNTLATLSGEENVSLSAHNENLTLTTHHHELFIKGYPTDDFPTIPVVEDGESFELSSADLVTGVNSVIYSASLSDIKPEIASVYIYPDGTDIVFVATDSIRLAEKRVQTDTHHDFSGIILPVKAARELVRFSEQNEGDVRVAFNNNQISFFGNNVYLTARIVNGNFPDYTQIIPKETVTEVTLLKQDLINALKMSTVFSDKFNRVDIAIDPEKKQFTVHSQSADIGETTNRLDAAIEGEALDISFNQRYITDVLPVMPTDSIVLKFSGANKPLIIKGVNEGTLLYLVMPING